MPIAIVMSAGSAIPAIISQDTEKALLEELNALSEAPGLKTAKAARLWLQSLEQPSGWFSTTEEASAHVRRMHNPVPAPAGSEVRAAREALKMSRAEFATSLGFGGNDNTRHKLVHDIEVEAIDKKSGKMRVLNANATVRMRALVAERGIGEDMTPGGTS